MDISLGEAFLWVAPAVGFAVHLTLGRYNARRVAQEWESLPTTLDTLRLGQVRMEVECDAETLALALDSARQARDHGDGEEAKRLLGLAHGIVDDATPLRQRRLRRLSLMVRMTAAATPLPPLRPASFRLRRLSGLAALSALLHHLLISPAERLLLRVHVLAAGFSLVRSLLARCLAAVRRDAGGDHAWRRFEAGADDFRTLDQEHLATASACLVSLSLEPRVGIVPHSVR